jgi:hypothetical protein
VVEDQPYHGYAFSEEENPNPELVERVRQVTIKRITSKGLLLSPTPDEREYH